jgi:hypothetical protein
LCKYLLIFYMSFLTNIGIEITEIHLA